MSKKKAKKKTGKVVKRKSSNKGIMKPLELSSELADFMGRDFASRGEIVSKIWAYIKKNDLQDPDDKRTIIPDDELSPIIGSRPINMMKIAGKISEHILS